MGIGDFGNFGGWGSGDHALNKMVFDEAHKKGGGSGGSGNNSNSGCALAVIVIILVIMLWLIGR